MNVQEKYQRLEDTVRQYNPGANFDLIHAAFVYAEAHHRGQNRKDGSPFITHPLAVAQIVAQELHLDSESIAAALLHDTIEDTDATHEDIARTFSPTIADIVEGVSKLTRVQAASKAEEQMENLRKMLLAMSKDIRVILIKMADRLHNMRTMEYQTPEKQKQKSLETMEIYAPIAHRLGMQKLKWELEDLSLKYLDPIGYQEIIEALEEKASEYDGFMASIHDQITKRLEQAGIQGIVYGRMKHPYSIYRKMYTQNKSLDDVFDLFAFRVIVNTVSECYNVLGIIHDLYKPVLGRFKDYIGTPKPNMYQSLHTTVVGDNGIPFEAVSYTHLVKEFITTCEYGETVDLCEGVQVECIDAGHLLGSASMKLTVTENGETRTIVFSGDIGNVDQPIIRDPQFFHQADFVVMESTYGNRNHTEVWSYTDELAQIIDETLGNGGNVVIPSFAVGRTQELLYFIREIKDQGLSLIHISQEETKYE